MRNIVLCGFMGCGKTSVGTLLAKRLGYAFTDTDLICEQQAGMSIDKIFALMGESGFRAVEHSACRQAATLHDTVIATGGGALTTQRNAELFKDDTVIFLDASFEEIERRIGGKGGRPLFKDVKKARVLYLSRIDRYKAASDITVAADGTAEAVVDSIMQIIGGHYGEN